MLIQEYFFTKIPEPGICYPFTTTDQEGLNEMQTNINY